ncbi:MAG: ATP-binding protein [Acidobacteriota bacterium]
MASQTMNDTGLPIDQADAERGKAERLRRFHTVRSPRLRVVGYLVFVAFAWAHNLILQPASEHGPLQGVTAGVIAYVALSWMLLVTAYDRVRRVNLGDVFLIADGLVVLAVIWATGGDRSLLFFCLILRAADQSAISSRRSAFFGVLSVVFYLGLMVGLDLVPGRKIAWPIVWVKAGFIAGVNFYLFGVAGTADRYRRRTSQAVQMTRSLVLDLEEKSRQLEDEKVKAQAASRAKSQFVANMSHEIRTPMNAIIGFNRLQQKCDLPDDAVELAKHIGLSGESLLQLIDDILDLSKVEAGKLDVEDVPFSLAVALDQVLGIVGQRAAEKGVRLALECGDDLPAGVRGDPARLLQVLLNLMGNAVKFTDRGTVTLRASTVDGSEDELSFEVLDTGIGIEAASLDQLFDPFVQVDSSQARRAGGTGLGLAISRRLVELMSGSIEVDSVPGVGSKFTVRLPLPAAEVTSEGPELSDLPYAELAADVNILVADDNSMNRLVVGLQLKALGVSADTVEDGRQTLEALARTDYDLLLLDCQMPELDGYETARRIRAGETAGRMPIIAMTAHAMKGDRQRCLEAGMDDYIAKPFNEDELVDKLARWLPGTAHPGARYADRVGADAALSGAEASGVALSDAGANGLAAPDAVDPDAATNPATADLTIGNNEAADSANGGDGEAAPASVTRPIPDGPLDLAKFEYFRRLGKQTGDGKMLTRVVDGFQERAPVKLRELETALATGELEAAAAAAHAMKGSSGTLGASRLAALCSEVEEALLADDVEGAESLCRQVAEELERTSAALEGLMQE